MTYPVFSNGTALPASDLNAIGLWRITTCTVTSAGGTAATASNGVITVGNGNTSVTVINAFSDLYDNYLITINGMSSSVAGAALYFQCITAGGVANAANWKGNSIYTNTGAGGVLNNGFDNNTLSTACASIDDNPSSAQFNVNGPYLSQRTSLNYNSTDTNYMRIGSSILDNSTSYTSFLIANNVGTISGGLIRVYGYRN